MLPLLFNNLNLILSTLLPVILKYSNLILKYTVAIVKYRPVSILKSMRNKYYSMIYSIFIFEWHLKINEIGYFMRNNLTQSDFYYNERANLLLSHGPILLFANDLSITITSPVA